MPAGLDGNPDPVASPARDAVLDSVANLALALPSGRTLVGVDGRSGAGKSTFADELATKLEAAGRRVLRSTTDSFHRPRSERMRLGPTSAQGFYLESHQLDLIISDLLHPFLQGATSVVVAAFDEPTDGLAVETVGVDGPAVLIFDGLFLQRPELEPLWDLVVFLEADTRSDREWVDHLLSALPPDPTARAAIIDERLERGRWPRYRHGWKHYSETRRPAERAAVVVDNNDFREPRLIRCEPRGKVQRRDS